MTRKALATKHGWKTLDILETKVVSETEDEGIVEAWVSTIGIKDSDADIIEPGAYTDTLKARTPVVCWGHDRNAYCGKVVQAEEYQAGAKELPQSLATKYPGAGSLRVLTEFNLKSTRGRDAFYDVKHRGAEQEWSIGYAVKAGDSEWDTKAGARRIKRLTLFEVSPVLAGASPGTLTGEVKEEGEKAWAQLAGSYEETRQQVGEALDAMLAELYPLPATAMVYVGACVEATFPDRVVARIYAPGVEDDTYWQVDYTIAADGTVTLGTPQEVAIEASVVPKEDPWLAVKEGRVLSQANMRALAQARRTIHSVLNAAGWSAEDDGAEEDGGDGKALDEPEAPEEPEVPEMSEEPADGGTVDLEMLMLMQEQERLRASI